MSNDTLICIIGPLVGILHAVAKNDVISQIIDILLGGITRQVGLVCVEIVNDFILGPIRILTIGKGGIDHVRNDLVVLTQCLQQYGVDNALHLLLSKTTCSFFQEALLIHPFLNSFHGHRRETLLIHPFLDIRKSGEALLVNPLLCSIAVQGSSLQIVALNRCYTIGQCRIAFA